ncbi:MAG: PQQ-binding-like beta-propeller repeat protein [Anaeromyxobacter sp.]
MADAVAIEVDGVDLAAGQAEAPLLPSLEGLLRAVSRVLSGEPSGAVALGDGGLELIIRRRGASALLTVVQLGRPSHVLARDVEVELEALAAAALEAAAQLCRELAEAVPGGAHDARHLRAAARDLRRTEAAPARPLPAVATRRGPAPALGRVAFSIEVDDPDGVLQGYEGGRPDLGSLLLPGRLVLHGQDGREGLELAGFPFLALRDLVAGTDRALAAERRGEPAVELRLARPRRGAVLVLRLDLAAARTTADGRPLACAPRALLRAVCEAALDLGRLARSRNPRQAENVYLTELEAAAAERMAELEELVGGDMPAPGPAPDAAVPPAAAVASAPLGPGRLRRLSFKRVGLLEVGPPVGEGLLLTRGRVVAAGQQAVAALDLATGARAWQAQGGRLAAFLPGAVLTAGDGRLRAVSLSTGRLRWERPAPGAEPRGAAGLRRGPWALVEPGAVTGLDPRTGATLWRFAAPGASRLCACAFGGVLVVAGDTGFVHGLDAEGRLVWRVRAPGPALVGPQPGAGSCLVACEAGTAAALLALDPATGVRRWQAALELAPAGPVMPWGARLAVPGTIGGDAAVALVERSGAVAWTAQPALGGAPALAATGALPAGPERPASGAGLLVVQDRTGALVALDATGATRWARPAGHASHASGPLRAARGTVVLGGEGVTCLDAATGEIVGALPAAAAARLVVDPELGIAALDLDGQVTAWRLGLHLSVVG